VPIIVCMYSLIPTAVLVYSLYMTVRIHQLQSTAILLNRGNRGSEAEDGLGSGADTEDGLGCSTDTEDGLGCSTDTATVATDASWNDRIETIGFHNVDCVQGGILFELMAGTMNVIIKHDDNEGGTAADRVLSQLAGRAIERGSSAVVHTVNSRLMSSSDYHYVRERAVTTSEVLAGCVLRLHLVSYPVHRSCSASMPVNGCIQTTAGICGSVV
jgi:hypothetical protein